MIFLRPWFLLLILIPFIFKIFRERLDTSSSWGKVIDEKLLPYLLVKGTSATAKRRSIYKTIIWTDPHGIKRKSQHKRQNPEPLLYWKSVNLYLVKT